MIFFTIKETLFIINTISSGLQNVR